MYPVRLCLHILPDVLLHGGSGSWSDLSLGVWEVSGFFIFKFRILSKWLDLRSRLRVRKQPVHLSTHFQPRNPVKLAYRGFFCIFSENRCKKIKNRESQEKWMPMHLCQPKTRRIKMKKMIVMLMVSAGFAVMAQNGYFYKSNGSYAGRANTMGNNTNFSRSNGMSAGRANTMGNNTNFYNSNGSYAGRSNTMGNTTYYYNSNGSSAGRAVRSGNTTYFYNSNGSSAGRANTQGKNTYFYNSNGSSAGRISW